MYTELSKRGVAAWALTAGSSAFVRQGSLCSTHVTLASLSDSPVNPLSSSLWLNQSSYAQQAAAAPPRPPQISPVCSLLRHIGCHTRPATPSFPHQSTLCPVLLILFLFILNGTLVHVCVVMASSIFCTMHAYRARTQAGTLILRANRYVTQSLVLYPALSTESSESTAMHMQMLPLQSPSSLGLSRCLIGGTAHQHLRASAIEKDTGLHDCLGQCRVQSGAAQDNSACFASGHDRELDELRENNQGCDCDKRCVTYLHQAE